MYIVLIIIFFILGMLAGTLLNQNNETSEQAKIRISILRKNKGLDLHLRKFPVYYINMDRSVERRESFEQEMKKYKMDNYKRVSALDGSLLKDKHKGTLNGISYLNDAKKITNSELAITLSHVKAIMEGLRDGHENIIVMEDDCRMTLAPYWEKNIEKIIEDIPKDCEIFLLSNRRHKPIQKLKIIKCPRRGDLNGVCYIVTKKGMEKVRKMFVGGVFDLRKIKHPVFDMEFMENFCVYTHNVTYFLLENLEHSTTHADEGNTSSQKHTISTLQYNTFLTHS